jgi:hypothetical protein
MSLSNRCRSFGLIIVFALIPYLTALAQEARPSPEKMARVDEEVCVSNLRAITGAQSDYWGGDPNRGYARTLKELGPAGVGFLEPVIATGKKDDYQYRLTPEKTAPSQPVKHYTLTARPTKRWTKDQKSFFTDETGVIRFTTENRAASKTDLPIESPPRQ